MDINWTSLLTGMSGGIIPAIVAFYMGKKSSDTAVRINEAKIRSDRECAAEQFENQLKKIKFEDQGGFNLQVQHPQS